jgi:hypothetical protein
MRVTEIRKRSVAGAASGLIARFVAFPADTIKARMQVMGALPSSIGPATSSNVRGALAAVRTLYHAEGIRGFYRGFGAVALGAVPAQATYFAAYEFGKSVVPQGSVTGDMATGCIAQLFAGVAFTPVDILKERLQVRSCMYISCSAAFTCTRIPI